ncbi:pyridoxine 5'-phosphate synthase [Sulfurospirillum deleyianum]|uniref:Pyridoxine 5'-phosphate synthase n=1 Tax=Sulfurospirillum deleyianum (strain ATCC 51133 / DSM 6946 / 5175) TaxID=525898 RepID=D1B2K2_SULD5|nr:pyridoxine 5'-phosphate synthase [Sulfurospirillum deleyianum]ACZ12322.1 pyridoxal phosphate biosynthetic protein PdxJ [Sulfurospirillum deleyianum DSM 6946]
MLLGINIDHIAVLREARKVNDPDPLDAISLVKRSGADQITIHLREDRRHINDDDASKIIQNAQLPVNLECSINEEIIEKVLELRPHRATLVPEKREEVTTEGGLDVYKNQTRITDIAKRLAKEHIELSLFIDPTSAMIEASQQTGAQWVELHTGLYANIYAMLYSNLSRSAHSIKALELDRESLHVKLIEATHELEMAAKYAHQLGLKVAAGHGLNYHNVKRIVQIKEICELNIGQSIIARSVFVGFESAIKEMLGLLR